MHVTHIPLELQKQNKDFQTLHEQANKMVYSFNRFESFFFEYWPNKNLQISLAACIILRIIFNFVFLHTHACANKSGFC